MLQRDQAETNDLCDINLRWPIAGCDAAKNATIVCDSSLIPARAEGQRSIVAIGRWRRVLGTGPLGRAARLVRLVHSHSGWVLARWEQWMLYDFYSHSVGSKKLVLSLSVRGRSRRRRRGEGNRERISYPKSGAHSSKQLDWLSKELNEK